MLIYHWHGEGRLAMGGVTEYVELSEDEESFIGDHDTEAEAIEGKTAPGFEFVRKYDTDIDIDFDFARLPLNRSLLVKSGIS